MSKRSIIVHFHFFKNAGTSIEHILAAHFREAFATFEPGEPIDTFPATALIPFLEQNPGLQAISSHTVCFPPPSRPDWAVFPIVFLRHPIDRVLSMYNYEKRQESDNPGAVAAKEHGVAGYIESILDRPGDRTILNYQAWMLGQNEAQGEDDDALLQAASKVVRRLPVVGVVDAFNQSVRQFTEWLAPRFPGLDMQPVHQNRTSPVASSMNDRLDDLKDRIGESLFECLEAGNAADLELYRMARRRLL